MRIPANPSRCLPDWVWGLLIVAATLGAYWPAMRGEFVFDDSCWTTDLEGLLGNRSGLWRIWVDPTALQQYYPLTGTTFWLDYHLWGWWTTPYHVENVLLHAACAILLWKLLRKLEVPGALMVAWVFALHPVMAESTAWITERKNVLSQLLFLAALLAYGRFALIWTADRPSPRSGAAYALAFVLFTGALLAKTTAFVLPAVILLLTWWKRGRIGWKRDVLPTLPFFVVSAIAGFGVAWIETHHLGAQGPDWDLTMTERILVAGRAPWFYAGKLLWPFNQCLIYPKWDLNPGSFVQWMYPLATAGGLLALWLLRNRIGRGPATAAFFFAGALFPVLGFMDVYGMRYSYVADRWTYLSSPGLLALAVVMIMHAAKCLRKDKLLLPLGALVLILLAARTWHEAGQYRDAETLWRNTIARNPDCWLAHNNLGVIFLQDGRLDEAIASFERALEIKPDYHSCRNNLAAAFLRSGRIENAAVQFQAILEFKPDDAEAHDNLAVALFRQKRLAEAIDHFQRAVAISPGFAKAHCNLGAALAQAGRFDEAIEHYQKALATLPDYALALGNMGNALFRKGQIDDAIAHYQRALEFAPESAETHGSLGDALLQSGRLSAAISHYQEALRITPDKAGIHNNLGNTLLKLGRVAEAVEHYESAVAINPSEPSALNNLALVLATSFEPSVRDGARAVELARRASLLSGGNSPLVLHTLAAAQAESGRFPEAVHTAQQALSIASTQGNKVLTDVVRQALDLYLAGKPFHDSRP